MELALERRVCACAAQRCSRSSAKMALTPVCASSKLPRTAQTRTFPAALGLHLRLLHVADAVFRVKDDDARARHVAEALQRRLAGIAAGGGEHGDLLPRARLVARGGHQARQKRERHVLEGAGGAAEEFEYIGVADLDERRQFVRLEFSGVTLAHDAAHLPPRKSRPAGRSAPAWRCPWRQAPACLLCSGGGIPPACTGRRPARCPPEWPPRRSRAPRRACFDRTSQKHPLSSLYRSSKL